MADTQNNWSQWWRDLGGRDRWILIGVSVGILVATGVAAWWVLKPREAILFSGLDPGSATLIANQLAVEGIPTSVDEATGKVFVDQERLYEARIRVMERGLLTHGSVGFELFDTVEFGVTDFAQRINYQRALEGELSRTILALEEIDQVRLHLVLPEPGLFRKADDGPKASLTVGVKAGATLSRSRVRALQRLVAAAVPGLKPEAVAIIDLNGNPLHEPALDGGDGMADAGGALESQRALEAYLSEKAQRALDATAGPAAASVVVNVELEHGQRQRHRETVLPVGEGITGAVTSMRSWGRGAPVEALPGPESIDPPAEGAPRVVTGNRDQGTEVHYEVGREVEELHSTGAQIRRITVSVIVPSAFPEDQTSALSETVARAVGLDTARGDRIGVHRSPMIKPRAASASVGGAAPAPTPSVGVDDFAPERLPWFFYAIWIGAVLIVGVLAWALGRRERPGAMSRAEREKLLQEVRAWLSREASSSHGKVSNG